LGALRWQAMGALLTAGTLPMIFRAFHGEHVAEEREIEGQDTSTMPEVPPQPRQRRKRRKPTSAPGRHAIAERRCRAESRWACSRRRVAPGS